MNNIIKSKIAQFFCPSIIYSTMTRDNKPEHLPNPLKLVKSYVRNIAILNFPIFNRIINLFILLMIIPCIFSKTLKYKNNRPDTLCNVGFLVEDEHECVCNRSRGDLDEKYMPCDYFLDVRKLSVICIKMRHVNLDAVNLSTNETYQQYFRRRMANIINKYCEDKSNECFTNSIEEKAKDNNTGVFSNNILLDDEKEPEFSTENVVLLRVVFLERNRTEVFFVVTKGGLKAGSLNSLVMMDPTKVKHIMSVQKAPLSRVLGGIHIEELRLAEFRKRRPPADNTRLINMIIVLGIGIGFCYLVVGIKQFRDCRHKRIATREKETPEKKNTRNYGTCTDHFLSNYEVSNGKPKSKAIPSQNKNISDTFFNDKDGKRVVASLSTPAFEPRKYQNMFVCDPSQLPQEIFHMKRMKKSVKKEPSQSSEKCSHSDLDEATFLQEAPLPAINKKSVSGTTNLPSVILVSSVSQEIVPEKNNNSKLELYKPSVEEAAFLDISGNTNLYERPLSRRGSRDSTPEEGGEEECKDNRETPQPIGDETGTEALRQGSLEKELSMTLKFKAPSSNRQRSFTWTSDSEDEEETRAVYHALKNDLHASDSEEEKSKSNKNSIKGVNPKNNRLLPTFHSGEISDSENEYGEPNEAKVLDRQHYERLQESPIPFTNENIRQVMLERESSIDMKHED